MQQINFFKLYISKQKKIRMIILRSQTEPQDVFFILRNDLFDRVVIKGEASNKEQEFIVTPDFVDYYGMATISPILEEGHSYTLKVYNGNSVVYYDTVYCTNQNVVSYDINENQYTKQANPDNDGFIIID